MRARRSFPCLHGQQPASRLGQGVRGVRVAIPLDERRKAAASREMAIGGNSDPPAIRTARGGEHFDPVGRAPRILLDRIGSLDPVNERGTLLEPFRHLGAIQPEPARAAGSGRPGVDRDDFEVYALAELQEAVMRSHEGMLAAGNGGDAQPRLDPARAFVERARRDDDMVEERADRI